MRKSTVSCWHFLPAEFIWCHLTFFKNVQRHKEHWSSETEIRQWQMFGCSLVFLCARIWNHQLYTSSVLEWMYSFPSTGGYLRVLCRHSTTVPRSGWQKKAMERLSLEFFASLSVTRTRCFCGEAWHMYREKVNWSKKRRRATEFSSSSSARLLFGTCSARPLSISAVEVTSKHGIALCSLHARTVPARHRLAKTACSRIDTLHEVKQMRTVWDQDSPWTWRRRMSTSASGHRCWRWWFPAQAESPSTCRPFSAPGVGKLFCLFRSYALLKIVL